MPRNVPQDSIVLYPQLAVRPTFSHNFGRIYGGQEAEDGQFPFAVHMYSLREGGGYFFSTSTILDENTLATCAHCLEDVYFIQITAGSADFLNPGPNAQIRTSEVFGYHEDFRFDDEVISADVGYVKVSEPFVFNDYVQPIELADEEPLPGELISAIGWGLNANFAPTTEVLHYVEDLVVVEDEVADIFPNKFVYEQFVCTFQESGGICPGDSGGPILNSEGKLFGATSFAAFFCESGPSCYTSLVYFKDWLRENADVDI